MMSTPKAGALRVLRAARTNSKPRWLAREIETAIRSLVSQSTPKKG
jgi:hypothetical protein